jgi:hypothetical protein
MPAVAAILSTIASGVRPDRAGGICRLPGVRGPMVAGFRLPQHNLISYLWTCDTCGYGFVTKHSVKRFACN